MRKVLFTATVDSHIKNFHIPYLQYFYEQGFEVHVATNGDAEIPYTHFKHKVSFERSPFRFSNLIAISQLRKIINKNDFNLIHCHTPMGGVITRLAAINARKKGTKVIYTAHGFHFYKGAPLINWLLYYPIERLLANFTDLLITINMEDYKRALKLNVNRVELVNGVGIEVSKYKDKTLVKEKKLQQLSVEGNRFIILSVGELNRNKDHETVFKALKIAKITNVLYLICGDGKLLQYLQSLSIKLSIQDKVKFLGHREDVHEIYQIADLFVFPSLREGLPVALLESLAAGNKVVCSDVRGNRDIVLNQKMNEIKLFRPRDYKFLALLLIDEYSVKRSLRSNYDLRHYDISYIKKKMIELYKEFDC